MIQTIPNNSQVQKIIYMPKFSAICSVGKAPFYGELEIIYYPQDVLLEFESFEKWIVEHSGDSLVIEEYCRLVFNTLTELLGDISLFVSVKAQTIKHSPVIVSIERK